ncbi:MAG: diguanylate cyclase, partial [Spirochaetaceae bacterium]|nr:diguanylate cyclase [Spirochaetaceae bacterium]
GLAFFPENGDTPGELVNAADQAMYQAKAEGKNRTAIHSS